MLKSVKQNFESGKLIQRKFTLCIGLNGKYNISLLFYTILENCENKRTKAESALSYIFIDLSPIKIFEMIVSNE